VDDDFVRPHGAQPHTGGGQRAALLLPTLRASAPTLGARLSYVHQQDGKPLVAYVPHVEKYRILIAGLELNDVRWPSSIDGAAFMVEAMRRCRPC